MNILIADDHTLFRDVLLQYIERAEPNAQVTLCDSLHQVKDHMDRGMMPDLALLDFRMPGMRNLDGLEELLQKYSSLKAVLISGVAEQEDIERAIQMGVIGYLPKTMSGKALIRAIQLMIEGEKFFSIEAETKQFMPSYYGDFNPEESGVNGVSAADAKFDQLTEREKQVLNYLMEGAANKEIANALNLQVVTVKLHVRGVCRKLGAKNRTQAALIAKEGGFDHYMKHKAKV